MTQTIILHEDGSITAKEASLLLGVTYRTINAWITKGDDRLPVVHLSEGRGGKGGPTRVKMSDVLAWREARAMDKAAGKNFEDDEDEDDEETAEGKPRRSYNYEKSKAKRMYHQANSAEIAEMRDTYAVLPVDLMIDAVEESRSEFKTGVLNLPGRLASRVAVIEDPKICYNEIRKECIDLLATLQSGHELAARVADDVKASNGTLLSPDDEDET